jgi:predicted CopG family antitoxin
METTEEKAKKLQDAYANFMDQIKGLEHERLEVMKRVIGDLEREEIEKLLQELKNQ